MYQQNKQENKIETILITAELPTKFQNHFITTLKSIQKADLYKNQLHLTFTIKDNKFQVETFTKKNEITIRPKDLNNPEVANTIQMLLKEYFLLCMGGTKQPGKTDFIDQYCNEHGYQMKYSSIRLSPSFQKMWINEFNNYIIQRQTTYFNH